MNMNGFMQFCANQAHTDTHNKWKLDELSGINLNNLFFFFYLEYYKCVSRPKWNKQNLKLLLEITAELDSNKFISSV